jgi:prepilin-type N-terminal cleavage/methylation domain-containing protein
LFDSFPLSSAVNPETDYKRVRFRIPPRGTACHASPLAPLSTFYFSLSTLRAKTRAAFTLLELMVVMGVIGIMLAFLIPALGPASGRSLEASSRQFMADLEGARLMAMAERTQTRVLIAVTNDVAWGQELALKAYMITSFNRSANTWTQRGKWNRLSQSVAFEPTTGIVSTRQASVTPVAKVAGGTPTNFTGAYLEFRANGGTSLDPNATSEIVAIADAIVSSSGVFTVKNQRLRAQIVIDPLTGGTVLQ